MNVDLTDEERAALRSALRAMIRKLTKNRRGLADRFGDQADLVYTDHKIGVADRLYEKLGGDPERIENR